MRYLRNGKHPDLYQTSTMYQDLRQTCTTNGVFHVPESQPALHFKFTTIIIENIQLIFNRLSLFYRFCLAVSMIAAEAVLVEKEASDECQFSVTFEISCDKSSVDYAVSSTLTFQDTKWALRFYPCGLAKDAAENATLAVYFLGGGNIVADCSMTILNHKHSGMNIVEQFKDVCFTKTFPSNSVGFNVCGNSLLQPKNGFFVSGLLHVKVDINIKSIENPTKTHQLQSQLAVLLFDDVTSDLAIFVGYEQIPAHKVILSLRSEVFKDIFSNKDTAGGTSECPLQEYVISDFDVFVTRSFLSFIYKDTIDAYTLSQHGRELFAIASKYKVLRLVAVCEEYLSSTLSTENAIELLLLADKHGGKELQADCVDFIVRHFACLFGDSKGVCEKLGLALCGEVLHALALRVGDIKDTPRLIAKPVKDDK